MATIPDHLRPVARENADYESTWTLTFNGAVLDLTGWTSLKASFVLEGTSDIVLTLNQVASAVQGLQPLAPLSAGQVRVYIPYTSFVAVPDGTDELVLKGDLVGEDPGGIRRVISDITFTIEAGVTQP